MLRNGTTLQAGRLRILRQIGSGGMGAVYEAYDRDSNNYVAIKAAFVVTDTEREHFAHEASLLAALDHPCLPRVIHYFAEDGTPYLVLELVSGDDFDQLLQQRGGPLDVARVLPWADQILGALHYLHRRVPPIIHRDIKPANLKLDAAGRIKVLDFGIAKHQVMTDRTVTLARSVSAAYSPIEQWTQRGTDARSDIYALGATLYHLVTGTLPPSAPDRLQGTELPSPYALNRDCPRAFSDAILRAMALRAEDRFPSADAMRSALQRTQPLSTYDPREAPRSERRSRRVLAAVALGGALAAIGGGAIFWPIHQQRIPVAQYPPIESQTFPKQADEQRTNRQDWEDQDLAKQGQPTSMAISSDGRTAASGFADGTVRLSNADDGTTLATLHGHQGAVTALAFAPDGRTLLSGGADRLLLQWKLGQAQPLHRLIGHAGTIKSIAFAPDGMHAASGSEDGAVRLWNLGDGTLDHALLGHTGPISALAWSHDYDMLASGSDDGTVRLWDTHSGDAIRTLRGYTSHVSALAFGPGSELAVGSSRGPIAIVRSDSETVVNTLTGHTNRVTALSFAPDGDTLASAGLDGTLRLWSPGNSQQLGIDSDATAAGAPLTFLSDGSTLACGSSDGAVHRWNVADLVRKP